MNWPLELKIDLENYKYVTIGKKMISVYSNTVSEWIKLKEYLYKRELYSKNTPN